MRTSQASRRRSKGAEMITRRITDTLLAPIAAACALLATSGALAGLVGPVGHGQNDRPVPLAPGPFAHGNNEAPVPLAAGPVGHANNERPVPLWPVGSF